MNPKALESISLSIKKGKDAGRRMSQHGRLLENLFAQSLESRGFVEVFSLEELENQENSCYWSQPTVAKDSFFPGRPLKVDFLLKHMHWKTHVAVECKLQNSPGSADQKLYFMGESLLKTCPYPSIILLMGNGFAKPAINYLNGLVGEKVKAILKFEDKYAWLDYMLTSHELAFDNMAKLKTHEHEQLEFIFEFPEDVADKDNQLQLVF